MPSADFLGKGKETRKKCGQMLYSTVSSFYIRKLSLTEENLNNSLVFSFLFCPYDHHQKQVFKNLTRYSGKQDYNVGTLSYFSRPEEHNLNALTMRTVAHIQMFANYWWEVYRFSTVNKSDL